MMSGLVSFPRYIVGVTYSRPLLRPRWCSRTMGAPSKLPPTLPSFARNSAMVLAFQSSGSLMPNSFRCTIPGTGFDRARKAPPACPAIHHQTWRQEGGGASPDSGDLPSGTLGSGNAPAVGNGQG